MVVGLDLLLGAQHGHGPVAEVIVQLARWRPTRCDRSLVPRPALLQHRLAHPPDEERLKQRLLGLVKEQVAMELAIGRQRRVEDQPQHRLSLLDVPEGVGGALELLYGVTQQLVQLPPSGAAAGIFQQSEQGVEVGEKPRVRRPEEKLR